MKSNDYVKYLTVELIKYIDAPRDVRKANKKIKKENRKHWLERWFGLLPMSLTLWGNAMNDKIKRLRS